MFAEDFLSQSVERRGDFIHSDAFPITVAQLNFIWKYCLPNLPKSDYIIQTTLFTFPQSLVKRHKMNITKDPREHPIINPLTIKLARLSCQWATPEPARGVPGKII